MSKVLQCPNCGSLHVKPFDEQESQWEKNTGYKSSWKLNQRVKMKYSCQELDCLHTFEGEYLSPSNKKRLTVDVDFSEWTYEITGKPFQTRKGTGVFMKVFRPDGLTYLAVAFGGIADDFLNRDLEEYVITAELNYDKKMELKLTFND